VATLNTIMLCIDIACFVGLVAASYYVGRIRERRALLSRVKRIREENDGLIAAYDRLCAADDDLKAADAQLKQASNELFAKYVALQ
jgi:hypothetical protein